MNECKSEERRRIEVAENGRKGKRVSAKSWLGIYLPSLFVIEGREEESVIMIPCHANYHT